MQAKNRQRCTFSPGVASGSLSRVTDEKRVCLLKMLANVCCPAWFRGSVLRNFGRRQQQQLQEIGLGADGTNYPGHISCSGVPSPKERGPLPNQSRAINQCFSFHICYKFKTEKSFSFLRINIPLLLSSAGEKDIDWGNFRGFGLLLGFEVQVHKKKVHFGPLCQVIFSMQHY